MFSDIHPIKPRGSLADSNCFKWLYRRYIYIFNPMVIPISNTETEYCWNNNPNNFQKSGIFKSTKPILSIIFTRFQRFRDYKYIQ